MKIEISKLWLEIVRFCAWGRQTKFLFNENVVLGNRIENVST